MKAEAHFPGYGVRHCRAGSSHPAPLSLTGHGKKPAKGVAELFPDSEAASKRGGRCAVSAPRLRGGDGAPPSSRIVAHHDDVNRHWLKGCWQIIAVAAAIVLGGNFAVTAAPKSQTPAATSADTGSTASFASFRLIGDWNIFDPSRVGRKSNEPPPPAGDIISLVGTMQYEKGLFAFFDSPDSDYRKALHVGDTIAQFTVASIMAGGVELTRDSKRISLAVGQQLHRPEGGQWTVSASARMDRAPAAGTAPAIPADASDVLRRLMEQRQKQLKQ